jgi:hypothetical protein
MPIREGSGKYASEKKRKPGNCSACGMFHSRLKRLVLTESGYKEVLYLCSPCYAEMKEHTENIEGLRVENSRRNNMPATIKGFMVYHSGGRSIPHTGSEAYDLIKRRKILSSIYIGNYYPDGGALREFAIRWNYARTIIKGTSTMESVIVSIEVNDEDWPVFQEHSSFFREISTLAYDHPGDPPGVDEMIQILEDLGYECLLEE